MSLIEWIDLPNFGDERGSLTVIESNKNIPFVVKRLYYIYDAKPDVPRGFHAHKELKQVAIAVKGSCRFLLDDGKEKVSFLLDNAAQGLLIESCIWREMSDFSEDCVLMVLADNFYDESDYIRDYDEFLKAVEDKE